MPKWVGPAIRKICVEFDTGRAVPHVWAGVESVLFLPCPVDGTRKGKGEKMEGKLAALVATIWLFVVAALESKKTSKQELFEDKKRLLGVLKGLKGDEGLAKRVGEEGWEGWEDLDGIGMKIWMAQIDDWINFVITGGWLEMEWRTNIAAASGASGRMEENDELERDEEDEEPERESKRMRRIGLGTMMQAKFDYLSDEKREAYAIWKENMLARIDALTADKMEAAER